MNPIREITVDHWAIELDSGESLRALNLGDAVELDASTSYPGIWIAAEFIGEFREAVRLQAGADIEDCSAAGVGCQFTGTRHAHPVDSAGQFHAAPGGAPILA
ncbi:hypothetical protein [Kitasatospora sp. P5_F3]